MHIVHCLTHSDIGGGQSTTYTLVKQLRREYPNIHFSIVLPSNGIFVSQFKQLTDYVIEMPFDKISLNEIFKAQSLFRMLKPDIIHSHGKGAGFYARFSLPSSHKIKHVHTYHGFHPPKSPILSSPYLTLEAYLLRNTDAVIAVSGSEGDELKRTFRLPLDKLNMIPNVVDCAETVEKSKGNIHPEIEEFLNRNRESCIVTMIARDDPVKNYELAYDSARLLLDQGINISFIFVGANPGNPALVKLKNLFPKSVAAFGVIEYPETIIKRSNIILLTSRKEGGLPLVLQEAFCLGKPVVGTNVPGIKDLVTHRVNGLLCDEKPESITAALSELQSNSILYSSLKENAISTARNWNLSGWAKKYYELYSRLNG